MLDELRAIAQYHDDRRSAAHEREHIGTLARIEPESEHIEHDAAHAPRTSVASAAFGALALVIAFVIVQSVAFLALDGMGVDVDVETGLGVADALALVAVQAFGILVVAVAAASGFVGWRRLGVRGAPAGSGWRGMRLLLPAGLVVIGPTIVLAIVDGDVFASDLTFSRAIAYVALAIVIAVNEELWFRGLLLDRLGAANKPWLTVVLGAVLFGLPHVGGSVATWLNAAAVTLAVAVPFLVVRLRVQSIWAMVVWHAVIDTWAFLHTSSVVAEGEPSVGELLGSLILPAIVATGYALWFASALRRVRESTITQ